MEIGIVKNKIYQTFDEAVVDVPDGATIMFPGFGGIGAPQNLMAALHRLGSKELTGISNGHGGTDGRVDVGTLIEAGQMRKMVCAFTAPTHPSQPTPFARMYAEDKIEAELVPQGTLAERIRCAGAGIGGFYTPTSVGTELAEGKEHRVINGKTYVLEYPCRRTLLSSGLGRRTSWATYSSACRSETSIPSWPWLQPSRLWRWKTIF